VAQRVLGLDYKVLLLRFWVRLKERRQEGLMLIESRMALQDRLLRLAVDTGEEGGSRNMWKITRMGFKEC